MNLNGMLLQGADQFSRFVCGDSAGDAHGYSHGLIVEQGTEDKGRRDYGIGIQCRLLAIIRLQPDRSLCELAEAGVAEVSAEQDGDCGAFNQGLDYG